MAGIGLWLTMATKGAFALVGFGAYLAPMIGEKASVDFGPAIGLFLLALITIINIAGAKKLKVVQKYMTLMCFAVLYVLTITSLFWFKKKNFYSAPSGQFLENGECGFVTSVGFVYMGY